ncbi:MAG: hypothetical protein ABSF91_05775 [Bacteroidota bacterium]
MKQKHQQTRFPLLGKHSLVDCDACHDRASTHQYAGTPLTCITCHQADFEGSKNPNHVQDRFPVDCIRCHRVDALAWPGSFDHNATAFPLTGAHRTVICSQCHTNNQFTNLATNCFSCHARDFTNAQAPNHVAGNFSNLCQSCHTTVAWTPSTFNHASTAFPLTGAHVGVECQSCHANGNYRLVYVNCYQCHQNDFQTSTNPNHVTGNFSHDCTQCHTTTGWSPASFDHASTRFPLTGSHIAVQCLSCHISGNYQITYTDCYQCHQSDYLRPTNPNHVTAIFSRDCTPCHTTTAWIPSTFSHSSTKLPLTGAHLTIQCQSCHTSGNYQLVYINCYQCHQNDFQTAANPNHVAGNFTHDCTQCHSTTAWSPATFDHSATKFPLTGTHLTTPCQSCHTGGNYQLVYADCYQCHQSDYQRPTNPNHVVANFGHDCSPCHTTTAWTPSTFNHDQQYFKIYSGRHLQQWTYCTDCHTNPANYATFSCINCHEHNQSETDSAHQGVAGYSYSSPACYNCHRNI